ERDYVYVRDVARANLLALQGRLPGTITNVGSGLGTTTQQLAERILSLTGSSSGLEQAAVRAGDVRRSLLDPSRFEQALGAPTPLGSGLTETARWYCAS
ncbi:MAG TPA: nucleoside-diphosphate-sugar epimerase, partial [Polyangiaceae bacterium]|nr:nucleoside-diphosphate-sugar epimerase [Polyangiaceae bacterium]